MFVELEIDLVCDTCGRDLYVNQGSDRVLNVEPCQVCLADAKKEGYEEGYLDGQAEAEN